jgi:hypothetical protein
MRKKKQIDRKYAAKGIVENNRERKKNGVWKYSNLPRIMLAK